MRAATKGDVAVPAGVRAVALIFVSLGVYLLVLALLIAREAVSFTAGAWLLGGMETAGPLVYLLSGMVSLIIAWGLSRLAFWARHLATVVVGVIFVLAFPTISGAVAYSQVPIIVREGLKIIICVIVFRYLNTGDAFAREQ